MKRFWHAGWMLLAVILLGRWWLPRPEPAPRPVDEHDVDFDVAPGAEAVVLSLPIHGQMDLFRLDLRAGRLDRVTGSGAHELHPSFESSGRTVLFSRAERMEGPAHIIRRDLATGIETSLTTGDVRDDWPDSSGEPGRIAFARASRYVDNPSSAAASYWTDWSVMTRERSGAVQPVTKPEFTTVDGFSVSASAERFSLCGQTQDPGWRVYSGTLRENYTLGFVEGLALCRFDVSADGLALAASEPDAAGGEKQSEVRLVEWRREGPVRRALPLGAKLNLLGRPRFSPDGRRLYLLGRSTAGLDLWVCGLRSRGLRHFARVPPPAIP